MGGPWEDYSSEEAGPWNDFGAQAEAPPKEVQGKPDASQSETTKMREKFIRDQGTLGTRLKNMSASEIAKEIPRFATEAALFPVNSGRQLLKSGKAVGSLIGSLGRGEGFDAAYAARDKTMGEFQPWTGGVEPSLTGQAIGTGIEQGTKGLESVTGDTGYGKAAIDAGIITAGAMGLGKMAKGAKVLAKEPVRMVVDNTQLPERVYGSAVKLPVSQKWRKTMGPEEFSKREDAITAGLQNEIMPNEQGVAQAKNLRGESATVTDAAINELDSLGNIIPKSRLNAGVAEAQRIANVEGTPGAQRAANNMVEPRFNNMGELRPGEVSTGELGEPVQSMDRFYKPSEMQQIKKLTQSMSDYEKSRLSRGLGSQIKELGNKGIAHEAMVALEELNPELKTMNRNTQAYISLVEGIEGAAAKVQNSNPVSLGSKVLMHGNMGLALADHFLGLPYIKARLGVALNKARTNPAKIRTGELREQVIPPEPTWAVGESNPVRREVGGGEPEPTAYDPSTGLQTPAARGEMPVSRPNTGGQPALVPDPMAGMDLKTEVTKAGGGKKGVADVAKTLGVPVAVLATWLLADDKKKKELAMLPAFAGLVAMGKSRASERLAGGVEPVKNFGRQNVEISLKGPDGRLLKKPSGADYGVKSHLDPDTWRFVIEEIEVPENLKGQKLGSYLRQQVIEQAKKRGAKGISSSNYADTLDSRHMWETESGELRPGVKRSPYAVVDAKGGITTNDHGPSYWMDF